MVPVVEANAADCLHLSGSYKGWCTSTRSCRAACTQEDSNNGDGKCQDTVPARCWCIKKNCNMPPDKGGIGATAASGSGLVKKE